MQVILTEEEYNALKNAQQEATRLAREHCQAELERVKDIFTKTLLAQTSIREAFSGYPGQIGGQRAYETWRDSVREVVQKLNMPQ